MCNHEHDDISVRSAQRALIEELDILEGKVALWASVKARTPHDVDVIARTAAKVIQRGALIGSASEPHSGGEFG